jgi:predicted deacetylase
MSARYLVRFDDLCPTANWRVWRQVEHILDAHGVKPLVAVVPDNLDPELVSPEGAPLSGDQFWAKVRAWQGRGWAIGLHGYQHRYVTQDAGLIGRNRYSEFASLSETEQRRKLAAGLAMFSAQGVNADAWVAPAHSFDKATVRLLAEFGVDCISDGYALFPHQCSQGQFWIPQQMARFRPLPGGVWTVCLHVNQWTAADVARFDADLTRHQAAITTVEQLRVEYGARPLGFGDRWMDRAIRAARVARASVVKEGATACTSPS